MNLASTDCIPLNAQESEAKLLSIEPSKVYTKILSQTFCKHFTDSKRSVDPTLGTTALEPLLLPSGKLKTVSSRFLSILAAAAAATGKVVKCLALLAV